MEKGKDCDQNFSLTPGIAIARIITSIAAANDLELHSIDIEQAFLQADKLMEGVNGRYFINPPPGSPDANNKDIVYEVLRSLYGNPSSPRALHKIMDALFKSERFDTIGFEESVWKRAGRGKYLKTSMCRLTWMTVLSPVNQRTLLSVSRRKYSHGARVLMKEKLLHTLHAS